MGLEVKSEAGRLSADVVYRARNATAIFLRRRIVDLDVVRLLVHSIAIVVKAGE